MTNSNRFIQFNDERINATRLLELELLAQALTNDSKIVVKIRKLMEYQLSEQAIAISQFWNHRHPSVEYNGQKSDVFLLCDGFWRSFDLTAYEQFALELNGSPIENFLKQLLILIEEFRLIEKIISKRKGLKSIFETRINEYQSYHLVQLKSNLQKGFLADALLNYIYLFVYGTHNKMPIEIHIPESFESLVIDLGRIFDSKETNDSITVVLYLRDRLEYILEKDLIHQYYAWQDSISLHEYEQKSKKVDSFETGNDEKNQVTDSVEERFQAVHREREQSKGTTLQANLQRGANQASSSIGMEEGNEAVEEMKVVKGKSKGNWVTDDEKVEESKQQTEIAAGERFGSIHKHVKYEVKRVEVHDSSEIRGKLTQWRYELMPQVKALVHEMKKRMDQKMTAVQHGKSSGRLSKNLLPFVTDERPKSFYHKTSPSKELDAVFSLLVDCSASMDDKIEPTKKAILLFHDVLQQLNLCHAIYGYYEDAFEAEQTNQPNVFLQFRQFDERYEDSGPSIMQLSAHDDNRDGFAIRWMSEKLMRRQEKQKFLFIFTDGEPAAFDYHQNGIVDTKDAVEEAKKKGIQVIHLFLNNHEATEDQLQLFRMMFGNQSASANSFDDFTEQTIRILRRMLRLVTQ